MLYRDPTDTVQQTLSDDESSTGYRSSVGSLSTDFSRRAVQKTKTGQQLLGCFQQACVKWAIIAERDNSHDHVAPTAVAQALNPQHCGHQGAQVDSTSWISYEHS